MNAPQAGDPLPPFFEFSSAEAATMGLRRPWQRKLTPTFTYDSVEFVVYVLDDSAPGSIYQEPPEFHEYGADGVFDATGRQAELAIEDDTVVVKTWSPERNIDVFERLIRAAADSYLPQIGVTTKTTAELVERLVPVIRQYQREQSLFWPIQRWAENLRRRST